MHPLDVEKIPTVWRVFLLFLKWLTLPVAIGCLLFGMGIAYAQSPSSSSLVPRLDSTWPRLFFDENERQRIEKERLPMDPDAIAVHQPAPDTSVPLPSIPLVTSLELQGISQTAKGRSAWLNGETVRSGDSYGGWRVDIEAHRIRLSAPQQKEVVLHPGQKVDLTQSETLDVVPAGSINIKRR